MNKIVLEAAPADESLNRVGLRFVVIALRRVSASQNGIAEIDAVADLRERSFFGDEPSETRIRQSLNRGSNAACRAHKHGNDAPGLRPGYSGSGAASMTAYYNENDPYAAQWLRNLIAENLIPAGEVDERSIIDVRADDLRGFTQCHFFAGIGGWPLALRLAGWPDDRSVWTGSCPCQPFSLAGAQRGFDDHRHLWPVWRRLIAERGPTVVYGEQVASATDWLRLVRSELEGMDYAVGCIPLQAASAGADHLRDRFYFVANANDTRSQGWELLPECADQWPAGSHGMADTDITGASEERKQRSGQQRGIGSDTQACAMGDSQSDGGGAGLCESNSIENGDGASSSSSSLEWVIGADGKARRIKSGIRLLANGVPARVGKLRAFGNAIYPPIAAAFIKATS